MATRPARAAAPPLPGLPSLRRKRRRRPWLVMAGAPLAPVALLALLWGSQVLKAFDYFPSWEGQQQMYKLDIGWPKIPEYFTGQTFCVAVDSLHGLVYVGQRGENVPKVLVFSEEGYFLYSWNDTVEMPHGIFVLNTATDSSVWITDVGTGKYGHTVKQYSPSGKLMQILGTPGNAGSSLIPLQFDQPAEVFVEESGDIYVVDGDGGMNNRLLKLSNDYKEIWLAGTNGTGIGQFKIPHSVTVDPFGRVWVADRDNKRIQVFDKVTGEWLGSWSSCFSEDAPYSVRFTANYKYMIVAQLNINRLAILAAPPVGSIGDCVMVNTVQLADETKPHLVDVDMKSGAVYVAEIGAQQFSTYDHKLVGQQMEDLSRKVRFIFSVESNSAVEPDGLISVLFEIDALNVNFVVGYIHNNKSRSYLAALVQALEPELQGYRVADMVHCSHDLEWELVSNIY